MNVTKFLPAIPAVALLVVAAALPARADSSTELGLTAAVVSGTHVGAENPAPVHGIVPGAVLEFTERVDRFSLHLEGIPTVKASSSSSGSFGTSQASLQLLNGQALVAVDANERVNVGYGFQLVNLSNNNGLNGDINKSRITSSTYALMTEMPLRAGGAFEANVFVDPNLRGELHVFDYTGAYREDKPEAGAEVDYAADYRWQRGHWVYRAGFRGLSYHTRDENAGSLIDKNVGAGVTFDVRYHFGKI